MVTKKSSDKVGLVMSLLVIAISILMIWFKTTETQMSAEDIFSDEDHDWTVNQESDDDHQSLIHHKSTTNTHSKSNREKNKQIKTIENSDDRTHSDQDQTAKSNHADSKRPARMSAKAKFLDRFTGITAVDRQRVENARIASVPFNESLYHINHKYNQVILRTIP